MRDFHTKFAKHTKLSLLAALTAMTIACGGGGGGGGQVAAPSTPGNPAPPPVPSREFNFPSFSSASKLTVVANFQTASQTPNVTGSLTAGIGNIGSVLARTVARTQKTEEALSNRCGFADACALNHILEREENPVRSQQIRPRFQELAAGQSQDFFILPAFEDITTEKMLGPDETLHCSIFAEVRDGSPILSRAKALRIAQAWDSNNPERPGSGIYDQVRAVFGSEWNQNPPGGNDGDDKVVLVFFSSETLGSSLFGFVSPADGNPNGGSNSNKGEIIYVNGDKSDYQIGATLSHEFQHLVLQNEKINQQGLNPSSAVDENISINEGLSGIAEEICGYDFDSGNELLRAVTNSYLEKPEEHEFFDFFQTGLAYGQGYLFFKYVREHFGDDKIREIAVGTGTGLNNLNAKLPGGFAEIFRRWTIANYATNLSGPVPSIYRYPSGFRTNANTPAGQLVGVNTSNLTSGQAVRTNDLRPWSASYLTIENRPGLGLAASVNPAESSPFGVIFEQFEDQFTSFSD